MRIALLSLTSLLALGFGACHHSSKSLILTPQAFVTSTAASPANSTTRKPDFASEIKPIFQGRCQPCHFAGGKVYDRLPFDKPETITRLGTKLFTRIKDEKEQRLIREFLAP
jgi:hypothetical protein